MSVALIFISHQGIASNMLHMAESILKKKDDNSICIDVVMDAPVEDIKHDIRKQLAAMQTTDGILFIIDCYGGTPGNIATQMAEQMAGQCQTALVSGINLPMVIRLLNYRDEDLSELAQRAIDGAANGIQKYIPGKT